VPINYVNTIVVRILILSKERSLKGNKIGLKLLYCKIDNNVNTVNTEPKLEI